MQERRMLNSLLDSVDDSVISADPRGTITRFNIAAERQFGWTRKEVLENNINIKEMMPLRFAVDHEDYLFNYLSTGNKKIMKTGLKSYGLRRDGNEFPIYINVGEVMDDGFHLFTGIIRDLTEDVKKEKMRQAEVDCVPQMIWKSSADGQAESLSLLFVKYTGVNDDNKQTVNLFSRQLVHKADYDESLRQFNEGFKRKDSFEVKRRLKSVDGSYNLFHTRVSPIFTAQGEIQAWVGSCTDIDEIEKLQLELKVLPDSLPVGLWKVDTNGDIKYSNKQFQNYLGITSEDNVNVFSEECVHPDDYVTARAEFEKGVKTKAPFEVENRIKGANGEYEWFMTRGTPILDFDDNLVSFYGTNTNINVTKEGQEELLVLPDSMQMFVWKASPRGDLIYANKSFKEYVGFKEGVALNVFMKANKDKMEFHTGRRLKKHDGLYQKFGKCA